MKNKVIMALALTVTLLVGVMIGGCSNDTSSTEVSASDFINFEDLGGYAHLREYRDTKTGVHYIIIKDGGICPRYNADGSLYAN